MLLTMFKHKGEETPLFRLLLFTSGVQGKLFYY